MDSNCTSKTLYQSVTACPGQKAKPGIRRRIFYVPKIGIAVWPVLNGVGETSVTMGDLAKYKGDFSLADGTFFQCLDLKPEASNVTFETVGERGSELFNNLLNAIFAGQPDALKGFARQAVSDDIVYVVQQKDGSFVVIGNEAFETKTAPSGDTGAESTGSTTSTFAINCYDECPIPTYVGKLQISETEQYDCATGKVEKISA